MKSLMDERISFCTFSVHCLGIGINQNCSRRKGHGFGCSLLVVVYFNFTIEKQAAHENFLGLSDGERHTEEEPSVFSVARSWAATELSLPIHPLMSDEDVACVSNAIRRFFESEI